jgi:ferric-dicitrate binding protein FerR (iron transport regulator)
VVSKRLRFFVGTMMLALVFAVAWGTTGNVSNAKAFGASTSLTILSGDVSVRHAGGAFVAAVDGQILNEGDTIRTALDARAILTYFEGSTVTIEPASEISIDNAETLADGGTVVAMTQTLGRTWHVVTKLITGSSKYEVKTPASTASVRGTEFQVDADATVTTVTTTEGTVVAHVDDPSAAGTTVDVPVTAGMTQTQRKNTPAAPARTAPAPERKATVTVGGTNGLVVDAAGRTNGVTKSGKVVVQTPGAQVKRVDGMVVVTLPNVLDGRLVTFVAKKNAADDDDVAVQATVEDRGAVQVLTDTATSDGVQKTGGFDLERANGKTQGRALDDTEKEDLTGPKTGAPSSTVLSGPQGTKRLVPATPEPPTVEPTRRPTTDKSKSSPRPTATPKPSTRSEGTPRSLVTLVPLANDTRLPVPTRTPTPTKRD